jgi:hypothetical protein
VVLLPGEILDSTPNTPTYFLSPWGDMDTPSPPSMREVQWMDIVTSREQWQKYLEVGNDSNIFVLIHCVIFLYMINLECVMAVGTFVGYSSIVNIANSKKRLFQEVSVCRLLVAILKGELYFKVF